MLTLRGTMGSGNSDMKDMDNSVFHYFIFAYALYYLHQYHFITYLKSEVLKKKKFRHKKQS